MAEPFILHMVSPMKHVSPFDVNMALDAGFASVIPYPHAEVAEVKALVQDAMFSRPPKLALRTGFFFGGKNAVLALAMMQAAKEAMFPPFVVSGGLLYHRRRDGRLRGESAEREEAARPQGPAHRNFWRDRRGRLRRRGDRGQGRRGCHAGRL
jgi:hypothetical protein